VAAQGLPDRAVARTVQRTRTAANADTSLEPQGLTRRVMLNILEAFFRRPWLHLIPLILMVALGISSVINLNKEFTSTASIRAAERSVITDVTDSANRTSFGFESPASATAREINELLRGDEFAERVAVASGLDLGEGNDALLLAVVRGSTSAFADGDELVRVSSTTEFPGVSQQLADATIQSYVDFVVEDTLTNNREAEQILREREAEDRAALNQARQDLQNAYAAAGITDIENVTDPEVALEIAALEADLARADTELSRTLDDLDQARDATRSAEAEINQRLRVVGRAQLGGEEPLMRKRILTMAVFIVLGVVLSLALVLLTATLDRTIRVPNDITAKYGLEVLAVVPNMRR
jgi:uncharacterized protein involved in exopolysaccharide biosynthesis